MSVRRAQTLVFRAAGLTDAVDATNAPQGSMQSLQNLIPNPTTAKQFVPRPASVLRTKFGGTSPLLDNNGNPLLDNNGNPLLGSDGPFQDPSVVECFYVAGSRIYGMVGTDRFAGKSEPFCYDLSLSLFIPVSGSTAANTPTTQPTTGDWVPPTMDMIANRIIITHPGYDGATHFVGWIDVRGFTSTGLTGTTHTSTLIDTLSASPIASGWEVGDAISGAGIPVGTTIVNMTATSVTLSLPTTASAAGVALTVISGTKAAPVYGSGQAAGAFPFPTVPVAVAQFNGRAYYAVGNGTQLSDSLQPLSMTGAGGTFIPILTMGNSDPVTALVGVPLANQVVGGTAQSLIAFKGAAQYWQITGDPATQNLANNEVNGSVGTLAPNSTAPTPLGIAYMAPDGIRFIGLNGQSSQPVGGDGQGVSVPFEYAIDPSRASGAYNQNVYRVTVQNGFVNGQPLQEYWYDLNLQIWSGPHTFPSSLMQPLYSPNQFVLTSNAQGAALYTASALPSAASSYVEIGVQMNFVWQPSLLPDNEQSAANQSVQGTLGLAMPAGMQLTILALNENGTVLSNTAVMSGNGSGSIWDAFLWGSSVWGSPITPYQQYALKWPAPLVFKQVSPRVTGQSMGGFVIGNAYLQYQVLGYLGANAA